MHGTIKKWLFLPLLVAILIVSAPVHAQDGISLESLTVQLWPEFDQPAMLVIYDFTLPDNTALPTNIRLRIPLDANLIAVAYSSSGSLLNAPYEAPVEENGWQVVDITVDTAAVYHVEYYAPLTQADSQRDYTYTWPGDYSIQNLVVTFKVPVDTTEYTTDPQMTPSAPAENGQTVLAWQTSNLAAGEQKSIKLAYTKTSDRLSVSDQPLETGPVDESTEGRVSLSNYLPYILGGLGILLIVVGGLYFWQASKGKRSPRMRHLAREDESPNGDVYCHQCGKRAQPADRFCRTCGTRLRKET